MLSEHESSYLGRIARGRTVHDIALEDGVAVAMIAEALNSAVDKLGATNLMDAVTKGMRLGLLREGDGAQGLSEEI